MREMHAVIILGSYHWNSQPMCLMRSTAEEYTG